jgi:putative solute:sodium symporter small subunit
VSIAKDEASRGARRRLPLIALVAWAAVAFAVPRVVQALNAVHALGFPLGYLMMAQGCLLALIVIAVLSARRQDRIGAATSERK